MEQVRAEFNVRQAATQAALCMAFFLCPASAWLLIPGVLSWSDTFLIIAFVLYLLTGKRVQSDFQIPVFLLLSCLPLIAVGFVSLFDEISRQSIINLIKLIASMMVVPIIVMWVSAGQRVFIERLLLFWLAGACLSSLVATLTYYGYSIPGIEDRGAHASRPGGLTPHPNLLSYPCALLIHIGIYFSITGKTRLLRLNAYLSIALLLAGIYVSGSRASFLAVAAGGIAWLPNPFRGKLLKTEALFLGILAFSLILFVFYLLLSENLFDDPNNVISRIFGGASDVAGSNASRMNMIERAMSLFYAAPILGHGFEDIRWAHSNLFLILAAGGLVGLLGFVIWWFGILRSCWALRQWGLIEQDEWMLLQYRLMIAISIVVLVNGAFEPFLTDRNSYIAYGLLLGCLLKMRPRRRRNDPSEKSYLHSPYSIGAR